MLDHGQLVILPWRLSGQKKKAPLVPRALLREANGDLSRYSPFLDHPRDLVAPPEASAWPVSLKMRRQISAVSHVYLQAARLSSPCTHWHVHTPIKKASSHHSLPASMHQAHMWYIGTHAGSIRVLSLKGNPFMCSSYLSPSPAKVEVPIYAQGSG